jgi:elongation factor G
VEFSMTIHQPVTAQPANAQPVTSVSASAAPPDLSPPPERIRNVVLVGHAGAGKTTLAEALLLQAGVVNRLGRVEQGTATTDHEAIEKRLGRSVSLGVASFQSGDVTINLIDTPGHPDFIGEVRAGLRAGDAVLFVVSAVDGVDATTRLLWHECAEVGMPRAVVITGLDHRPADFGPALASCRAAFGEGIQPLYLPLVHQARIGLHNLLSQRVTWHDLDHRNGGRDGAPGIALTQDATPEQQDAAATLRSALIEGIIQESEDDTLLDRWLSGEDLDIGVLIADLERAVGRGTFYPVLPVVSPARTGVGELLDLIVAALPSPCEHPLPPVTSPDGGDWEPLTCDADQPLVAEVVKTTSDQYLGQISIVRIFSGRLAPDDLLHVCGHLSRFTGDEHAYPDHEDDERAAAVSRVIGARLMPMQSATAGDIVAVTRLGRAATGDTISHPSAPALARPWRMPEPLLPTALTAATRADEDKLSQALARISAQDPAIRVHQVRDTHQIVLWAIGELHRDIVLERLADRYGVQVGQEPVRVSLRETLAAPATGHGRHVKQSGGHGQYAVCDVEAEPLPMGSGYEFVDRVVGGAVPRQFIASVEKGVRAQLERGVAAGYPLVDLRVTLVGGKAHSVDSSDAAFQAAGALALREAASAAGIVMLEPVDEVTITVDDEYVGGVMGDLSSRRGRVTGSTAESPGRTTVMAQVPAMELMSYVQTLRSLAHGSGSFTRAYLHHAPMPQSLADQLIAAQR